MTSVNEIKAYYTLYGNLIMCVPGYEPTLREYALLRLALDGLPSIDSSPEGWWAKQLRKLRIGK